MPIVINWGPAAAAWVVTLALIPGNLYAGGSELGQGDSAALPSILTQTGDLFDGLADAAQPTSTKAPTSTRFEAAQMHMGTLFKIAVYAPDRDSANRGMQAAFARIGALDRTLSDYRTDSELSRLSQSAPTPAPRRVSRDVWTVLAASQDLSRASNGAFDVTVGPLTKLWRRARRQGALPLADRLRAARAATGFRHLVLDKAAQTAALNRPGMRLDLGGIAKGFAADEALRVLADRKLPRALVNAGGDLAIGEPPPGKKGWKIGIAPLRQSGPPSQTLELSACGVATSGDAFQFVEIGGRRYSHIVDPRTGLGLTVRGGVTVIAPTGMLADGLASTVSVLGPLGGIRLVDQTRGSSTFIVQQPNPDEIVTFASRRWPVR